MQIEEVAGGREKRSGYGGGGENERGSISGDRESESAGRGIDTGQDDGEESDRKQ